MLVIDVSWIINYNKKFSLGNTSNPYNLYSRYLSIKKVSILGKLKIKY